MKRYIALDMEKIDKVEDMSINLWILCENISFLSNNDYRACYASKNSLAEHQGLSERQIRRIIEDGIEKGYIEKTDLKHLKTTKKWFNLQECKNVEAMTKCQKDTDKMSKTAMTKCPTKIDTIKGEKKEEKNTKKDVCDSKISISSLINFYKENISNKQAKVKEQLSYSAISLQSKNLEEILTGLKNYSKALPEDRYIVNLQSFVRDKIYLDYQEEVIEIDSKTAAVPQDLIGKVYVVSDERIEFRKNSYYKQREDHEVTNPSDVKAMIELIRGAS